MSRTRMMMGTCFAMLLAILALGCAGTAGTSTQLGEATAQHAAGWIPSHYAEYVKAPEQCRTCHGSTADPILAGGIAKVSCFTCHTSGVNHPATWALPGQHGRLGAQAAPVATTAPAVPVMAGFAHCAKCHGSTYDNGLAVSCKSCHTRAPHPNRPWTGTTVGAPSHVQTNQSNVGQCAVCHLAGANSLMKPLITPPAGTAPGCFNETLCHGTNIKR